MAHSSSTRERILDASRRLFNERGYAATSLAEIAKSVGIAKGNLTYHFPTKYELVLEFARQLRAARLDNIAKPRLGTLADEYVEVVHAAMEQAQAFRFLDRDRVQFHDPSKRRRPNSQAAGEIERLREMIERLKKEGMLRQNLGVDLETLARTAWMVSRFWVSHIQQSEAVVKVTWADQERGIRHHLAVLMPCLTASGRREFESALIRLSAEQGMLFGKSEL